jgi:SAM-dependent methyltransferase
MNNSLISLLLVLTLLHVRLVTPFSLLRGTSRDVRSARTLLATTAPSQHDNNVNQKQSRRTRAVQTTLERTGHKYYCATCGVGFKKQKNFQQHIHGRTHQRVESERVSAWLDFCTDVPTWTNNSNDDDKDKDDDGVILDVYTQWAYSELDDFPHRSSCIHPSATIESIGPKLRARFWRYLRDSFGQHYSEFAPIFHEVSLSSPRYLRVKELFESLETFKLTSSIILMAQSNNKTIDTVYDLACGHGLVGILLAYRFPKMKIICVDLEARESFLAFQAAWRKIGDSYGMETPLANIEYREADLLTVRSQVTPSSFLVATHACNEANRDVVDMANAVGALWAVMPCCIPSNLYLKGGHVVGLDDDTRYMLLSGAFAEANNAQLVRTIHRDITARPILIAGGLFPQEVE